MSNDLIVQEPKEIVITNEQVDLIRETLARGASDAELKLYFYDCRRRGVHPLDNLIHFTKRGGKYTPITSIDMFRMRAAESGAHAGTNDAEYDGEPFTAPFTASVTVYKMVEGKERPFTASARWAEYYPGDDLGFMWRKMPFLMLGKCAEALALRKAFPAQLQGLYIKEEMEQAGEDVREQMPKPKPLLKKEAARSGATEHTAPPVSGAASSFQPVTADEAEAMLKGADSLDTLKELKRTMWPLPSAWRAIDKGHIQSVYDQRERELTAK